MLPLFNQPFWPRSGFVRVVLGEYGLGAQLVEERVWERHEDFLALNPAGTTPALLAENQSPIPGVAIIAEYIDETHGADMAQKRLLPLTMAGRIEVRLLVAWFKENVYEN